MSSRPPLPDPADHASPTPVSQRDEDARYYREILHELIEIGADLARAVHCQATPEPSAQLNTGPGAAPEPVPAGAPQPDPTLAFDRIARTLRRTIALARTITEPAPLSPAQGTQQRRLSARKQIIREVEDTIQRRTDGTEAEALRAEFHERLDTPDLDDDIDQLPVADIIAAICRDLGIAHHPGTHPWKRRTPRDMRDLCARAAASSARGHAGAKAGDRAMDPRPHSAPPLPARPGTGPPAP